jgi:hypothetical protein
MTNIAATINAEAIAGHLLAIDKPTKSIGDRMNDHGIGKAAIDAQINQDIEAHRILIQELKEMRS